MLKYTLNKINRDLYKYLFVHFFVLFIYFLKEKNFNLTLYLNTKIYKNFFDFENGIKYEDVKRENESLLLCHVNDFYSQEKT